MCLCQLLPIKAVVGVVSQCERRHNQTTRHGAHLLAQPLSILADPLVSVQSVKYKTTIE